MQKFSANALFLVIFAFYDTHDTHIKFFKSILLILAHFANFKAKIERNGSKKLNIFYKCVLESHLTSISGLGGFIFSKKSNSLYPNQQCQPEEINCLQEYTYRACLEFEYEVNKYVKYKQIIFCETNRNKFLFISFSASFLCNPPPHPFPCLLA
jgi:hypothetical protein